MKGNCSYPFLPCSYLKHKRKEQEKLLKNKYLYILFLPFLPVKPTNTRAIYKSVLEIIGAKVGTVGTVGTRKKLLVLLGNSVIHNVWQKVFYFFRYFIPFLNKHSSLYAIF